MNTNRVQLSRAWRFLSAWMHGEAPPDGQPPYWLCAEVAFTHRLEPMLGLRELPAGLPPSMVRRFHDATLATRAAQVSRFAATQDVLAHLASWPVVVFKGFAAAEQLYADIGARSMGDVDLLVLPEHFQPVLAALRSTGFQQAFVDDPVLDNSSHHERELSNGRVTIDLHQAFTQAYRVPLNYEAIVARSLPWTALAPNARILAPEDAVLAQAIHLGIGELTPDAAPAIGFCDLRMMLLPRSAFWRLVESPALDLERLLATATAGDAGRMLYAVLAYACALFPSLEPSLASRARLVSAGVRRTLDVLVRRAFPPSLHNPPRAEMLWRKGVLLPFRNRRALFMRQLPLQLRYHLGRIMGRYE